MAEYRSHRRSDHVALLSAQSEWTFAGRFAEPADETGSDARAALENLPHP